MSSYAAMILVLSMRLQSLGIPISEAKITRIAAAVLHSGIANDVDPVLLLSLIEVESRYNVGAVSSAACRGLTQLDRRTAKEIAGRNFDINKIEHNIEIGARYLRHLILRYPRDLRVALTAYNVGPGTWRRQRVFNTYYVKVFGVLARYREIEERLR